MALIEVTGLKKVYGNQQKGADPINALGPLNLNVSQGEFVSLLGPSGCGKSSFLRILAGLESPSAGKVSFNGAPIVGPSWRRGMVFQEYALPPWKNVLDNVALGLKFRGVPQDERNRTAKKFIELVGLKGFEARYPGELSGGMKQRCALARTLANNPDVLLMDEPFAALDAQTREILQEELLKIWGEQLPKSERKVVIFVTHSIDEAVYLADRIVLMSVRPGAIKQDVLNQLPRPRSHKIRISQEFLAIRESFWSLMKEDTLTMMNQ
jgi:ABC-type nitrate/sulfonate/bicarbonate transport system, ATPase component